MAANTRYNLNYLDDQYGISPADSEEEYAAAGALAQAYQDRGLTAHIQDFTTPGQTDLYRGILMIVLMVTMLLSNVGSMILGIASIIVGVVAAVALVADVGALLRVVGVAERLDGLHELRAGKLAEGVGGEAAVVVDALLGEGGGRLGLVLLARCVAFLPLVLRLGRCRGLLQGAARSRARR